MPIPVIPPRSLAPYALKTQLLAASGQLLTVTVNGQTTLTLPSLPADPAMVSVEVNGVRYRPDTHFTVSGTALTWLNGFTLSTTDIIYVML